MDIDWEDLFGPEEETLTTIPGLCLVKQALGHKEQMEMVQAILDSDVFSTTQGRNQAMVFGQLPHHLEQLSQWVKQHLPHLLPPHLMHRTPLFDQAIMNLYCKGEGIASHVDLARFDDGIIILSLLSSCVMTLSPVADPTHQVPVFLQPGDILSLSGPARYAWEHGIKACLYDEVHGERIQRGTRISVTLRKLHT
ncbi:hypothetical protein BDF14DRAFT_1999092 [Spinellus fusiger]|nr:hypothetical protein BDF14DRAFT_1999092 [Spinellus fusiger]